MIKNIVYQHKFEKENLINKEYIFREKLNFARKFIDSDLIKIITGPRRSGKSIAAFLLLKGKKFAYLNFDDENLLKVENYDDIIKALFEVYPDSEYLFFDEIQNLKDWEIFVNKLKRRGYNLILTGSNAKLLSKELATVLTGRYIPIEIFPFSFREFLKAKGWEIKKEQVAVPEVQGKTLSYLNEYLTEGGFPEVVVKNIEYRTYLETLSNSILFKDVVKRYNLRYSQKIYDLNNYLNSNYSSEFSFSKLRNILEFRSTVTLQNYLNYLEEAFLIFILNRFSFKVKEQIKTPKKVYVVDNGFCSLLSSPFSQDSGKLMENLVFVEILRRGYKLNQDVFSYKTKNNKEVDFLLKKGIKIEQLIQVCYRIEEMGTEERESKALIEASQDLSCNNLMVITWDRETEKIIRGKKIVFMPLWKWLLI
ncbi:MAG: ATP-binding protein [Cyanobacteria bacterium]|nr:ATP-binding protein [Cyanobacteriota bacterium]